MVIYEADTPKYTVRVHSGKRTEEERKEVLKNAAEKFFRQIQADLDRADRDCAVCEQ